MFCVLILFFLRSVSFPNNLFLILMQLCDSVQFLTWGQEPENPLRDLLNLNVTIIIATYETQKPN